MSPKRAPPRAAGPATVASTMNTPLALRRPSESASGSSTGSILTPSQPFWPSVERLPTLIGSLTRRPICAGRIGADGLGVGATGWGLAGTGSGCGETGVTGDGTTAEGPVGMRTMSTPEPAIRETGEAGPEGRADGAKAVAAQAQSVVTAPSMPTAQAMRNAAERPRDRRDDGGRCASVIAEAPGQDILGYFLGDVLGCLLACSFASRLRQGFSPSLLAGRLAFSVRGAHSWVSPGWALGAGAGGGTAGSDCESGQPSSTAAPALPAARVAGRLWPAAPNRSFAVAAGRLSAVRPGAGWCPARWSRACPVRSAEARRGCAAGAPPALWYREHPGSPAPERRLQPAREGERSASLRGL